ncbi:MAG: DEAD/DEAH box helicase [Actinobacteria bacterium]|nr:DEAD/DEAH box helicase [Actinomycetota bacterium]
MTITPAPHPFRLDRFQLDGIEALDRGASVLVAAPTGSGKTVVADHAVALARQHGKRAFYTTPIKALSNQKYHDLVRMHGSSAVGLLTGDNAINGDAPIVVMTTEVLRNMLYAGSSASNDLEFVVLDEVHYLQDAYRGPVWEEVIIHLPAEVRLVCLSATVSNADEVAGWLETVRGSTALVLESTRPVQLDNLYLVGDKMSDRLHLLPTLVGGKANGEASRFDAERPEQRYGRGRPRRRYFTPHRVEIVDLLRERAMLPAICFIFSRVACDDATRSCLDAGVRLTNEDERTHIREIVEAHVRRLSDSDLAALNYDRFLSALEAGVAPHHAGMVPPFKEAVEACFVEGLVKVVFATETLALGINMPARTVVIEKLTKFTGEHHEFLTPGQYTQLTGRAGRRGIDEHGNAIVLWSPWVPFADIAALAASRSFPLASAFRPTYNMAANLVRRYEPEHAHHLLNLSFAQYQADNDVVRLEARLANREAALQKLAGDAACELGDVGEYAALAGRRRAERQAEAREARSGVDRSLRQLVPGDVIAIGRRHAVVLSVSERKSGSLRVRVADDQSNVRVVGTVDFTSPPPLEGTIDLPVPFLPDDEAFRREVVKQLRALRLAPAAILPDEGGTATPIASEHPVASCPDRDRHVQALRKLDRTRTEIRDLRKSIRGRTESLARRFDRVLGVLESWGYLEGWSLTGRGEQLVRIFHESDLLVAESLEEGILDELDPAALAGLVSCFTYEHRSPEPAPPPWFPNAKVRHRFGQIEQIVEEINNDEREARLPLTRRPDPTFLPLAYSWAAGEELDDVLEDEDLSGGDFVRNIKQLIDLLRQVADASTTLDTARAARQAADALFRGVVSVSSVLEPAGVVIDRPAVPGEAVDA